MIDTFGRTGKLDKAEEFANKIPNYIIGWISLLSSCRIHKDLERSERVSNKLFELEDYKNPSTYILLSNIYSQTNQFEKQKELINKMNNNKVKNTRNNKD